jgi:hypothetical protein
MISHKPSPSAIAANIGKTKNSVRNSIAATLRLLDIEDELVVANIIRVFYELKQLQHERVQSKTEE